MEQPTVSRISHIGNKREALWCRTNIWKRKFMLPDTHNFYQRSTLHNTNKKSSAQRKTNERTFELSTCQREAASSCDRLVSLWPAQCEDSKCWSSLWLSTQQWNTLRARYNNQFLKRFVDKAMSPGHVDNECVLMHLCQFSVLIVVVIVYTYNIKYSANPHFPEEHKSHFSQRTLLRRLRWI